MKKVSIKGVVIGAVTDILASNVLAISLMVYVVATHGLDQVPKDQVSAVFAQTLLSSPGLLATQLMLGAACSVLGGYVAARIAKHDEILNGTLASFLCMGIGIYSLVFGASIWPLWLQLAGFVFSPALSALGGYIRTKAAQPDARA